MKSIRGFALGLALGIAAAIASVGLAQTTTKPADQNQKAESCCAMTSCCHGDVAKHGSEIEHAKGPMKHSSEGGCCCCSGDSCEMQMKKEKEAPKQQ